MKLKAKTDKFVPNIKIGSKILNEKEIQICIDLCNKNKIAPTRGNIVAAYKTFFF